MCAVGGPDTPTSSDVHSHAQLVESSHQISDACTKLSLLFSKPPLPSLGECSVICEGVEGACDMLVGAYRTLEGGTIYLDEAKMCVLSIMEDLNTFLSALTTSRGTR